MRRQVVDGLIILAVLALGATHLYAQSAANRRIVHAKQVEVAAVPNRDTGGKVTAPQTTAARASRAGACSIATDDTAGCRK